MLRVCVCVCDQSVFAEFCCVFCGFGSLLTASVSRRMETVSQALEELLVAAQRQDCLTVGVYESAKLMNV